MNSYYGYGKDLPTGTYSSSGSYSYGFNGKERESHKSGQYDFGARIMNTEFPMFLSRDPLLKDYTWLSPYAFAANNPIKFIDKNGEFYLNSDEVMVEVINGKIAIKLDNASTGYKRMYYTAQSSMKNWAGNIGTDMTIGYLNISKPQDSRLVGTYLNDKSPVAKLSMKMKNGPRSRGSGETPTSIGVSTPANFRGAAKIGVTVLVVDVADKVLDAMGNIDMRDVIDQRMLINGIITKNIQDAIDLRVIPSDLNIQDKSQLSNLLLGGESKGATANHIKMYNDIINTVIIPTIVITNDTEGSGRDNTTTTTKSEVPADIDTDTDKEGSND